MKTLKEYILEADNNLNVNGSIDYEIYSELFLFIRTNGDYLDRIQLICDKYRKEYNENISAFVLLDSIIYKKLIDDAIKDYCEEYKRNIEDVNLGTKRHLRQEIASYMITKIKLDYDPIISKVEEE